MDENNGQLPDEGNQDQNNQNDQNDGQDVIPANNGEGVPNEDQGEGDSNQTPADPQKVDPLQALEAIQGLDPKVKEALKAGFLRHADYTKKTQDLAGERTLLDEYKELKPYFDKALANPELYEQVFGVKPGEVKPEYPEDPAEYAEYVKNRTLEAINQEIDFKQAEGVDPRLNADEDFAITIAGIVAMDPEFVGQRDENGKIIKGSQTKSAVQATQEAVKRFDSFLSKQKELWRKEMNAKAKERRMSVPNQGTPVNAGGGKVPATMQEAAAMAEEQIQS